jgi:predicted outer membrane repeat protein
MIIGNTIVANSANDKGGGIYCDQSSPTIKNTILWENRALVGREIFVCGGCSPIVTYCDVQCGWEGEGNFHADPIFVGRERDDFHLRWHSPCIDTGDPSLNDPDGTRAEIGALYFDQDLPEIVELYPHDTPIVIPPEGGELLYDGWVFNFSGQPGEADLWTYAFIPEIGHYGPINLCQNLSAPVDSVGVNGIIQSVPGSAPAGTYAFVACVGRYPSIITDLSYFYFTKTGSTAGGTKGWFEGNGWFKEVASTETDLPRAHALSQNYPNPFNVTTVINYQLPTDAHVKLEVYNTLGQKVAILVNENQRRGYRSVIWDGSELSSGLYLYKLTAGDFTKRKIMTLVK